MNTPAFLHPSETFTVNAALNAARISLEIAAQATDSLTVSGLIAGAAVALARAESAPGFRWDQPGRLDWESACAALGAHCLAHRHHRSGPDWTQIVAAITAGGAA